MVAVFKNCPVTYTLLPLTATLRAALIAAAAATAAGSAPNQVRPVVGIAGHKNVLAARPGQGAAGNDGGSRVGPHKTRDVHGGAVCHNVQALVGAASAPAHGRTVGPGSGVAGHEYILPAGARQERAADGARGGVVAGHVHGATAHGHATGLVEAAAAALLGPEPGVGAAAHLGHKHIRVEGRVGGDEGGAAQREGAVEIAHRVVVAVGIHGGAPHNRSAHTGVEAAHALPGGGLGASPPGNQK